MERKRTLLSKVFVRGMEDKFSVVTSDGARQEGQLFHHSGDKRLILRA
ncbi:hypothetical protein O9992_04875 [Vibrio lentus]|nr:hypothetical protein [Vibrio lentus]